jgi:phytoene desaturase
MPLDVLVIGSGVGGLSAAIYARLQGHSVSVVEQREVIGGKAGGIEIGSYSLDPGPSIIVMPEVYKAVFEDAGRKMEDYLRFKRLDPICRVFFEGMNPLDLPSDDKACIDLVSQISSNDAESLRELFSRVAEVEPLLWNTVFNKPIHKIHQLLSFDLMKFGYKLGARGEYKRQIDKLFESDLMRAFFYGFPSYSGQSYRSQSPSSLILPYYMLSKGVYFPHGGVRQIPKALYKLALELGVGFQTSTKVVEVIEERNRISEVRLNTGEALKFDHVICNMDRFSFESLRGIEHKEEPSYSYFTVQRGICKNLGDLSHHNIFIPRSYKSGFEMVYDQGRFPDEPIVYVNRTSASDPDSAPLGCENLFSVVTCPGIVPGIDWDFQSSEFSARIDRQIHSRGISWKQSEIEFERVQSPVYFKSNHNNYRGSIYGLEESHRMWGMFPASIYDRKCRNLTYCGGSVQPGAGLPMVTLSGKFAAQAIKSG